MAGIDYVKLQGRVSGVTEKAKQGTVLLERVTRTASDPTKPWVLDTEATAMYALSATVTRVSRRYVNGSTIIGTEDQITLAVPPVTPEMTDRFVVDGRARVLKDIRPIPAAGTPVAYVAIVEA